MERMELSMRKQNPGLGERLYALLVRLGLAVPGKVMYIGGSDTLPAPLGREEEARLIARLGEGDRPVLPLLQHLY